MMKASNQRNCDKEKAGKLAIAAFPTIAFAAQNKFAVAASKAAKNTDCRKSSSQIQKFRRLL